MAASMVVAGAAFMVVAAASIWEAGVSMVAGGRAEAASMDLRRAESVVMPSPVHTALPVVPDTLSPDALAMPLLGELATPLLGELATLSPDVLGTPSLAVPDAVLQTTGRSDEQQTVAVFPAAETRSPTAMPPATAPQPSTADSLAIRRRTTNLLRGTSTD